MKPILLSQNNPKWKNKQLGTSKLSIGQAGCTISCIAMKFNTTPDHVNERINVVDGYLNENLIIWKKLEAALPGVIFKYKYASYDNDLVKANIPCLVEVDGTPIGGARHWVLFIGDHKIYDPWDGTEKLTSAYKPLGFVILEGEYVNAPKENQKQDGCLVPNTSEWRAKYENLVKNSTEHDKFVKAGYSSFTDVMLRFEQLEKEINDLKKGKASEIADAKVSVIKEQLPSIVKAAKLIEEWGISTEAKLAQEKKPVNKKVNVIDSVKAVDSLNWLAKLLKGEGVK